MHGLIVIVAWPECFMCANTQSSIFGERGKNGPRFTSPGSAPVNLHQNIEFHTYKGFSLAYYQFSKLSKVLISTRDTGKVVNWKVAKLQIVLVLEKTFALVYL